MPRAKSNTIQLINYRCGLKDVNPLGRQFGCGLWERHGEDTVFHDCLDFILLETNQHLESSETKETYLDISRELQRPAVLSI